MSRGRSTRIGDVDEHRRSVYIRKLCILRALVKGGCKLLNCVTLARGVVPTAVISIMRMIMMIDHDDHDDHDH